MVILPCWQGQIFLSKYIPCYRQQYSGLYKTTNKKHEKREDGLNYRAKKEEFLRYRFLGSKVFQQHCQY